MCRQAEQRLLIIEPALGGFFTEGLHMLRRYGRNITAALGLAMAMGIATQAAVTNFGADVGATIDASIAYMKAQNYFTTGGNINAQGLVLLVLLEKHASADFNAPILGYSGLAGNDGSLVSNTYPSGCPAAGCPTLDKLLAQYSVQRILDRDNYGQYAYYDGNYLMALSEYLKTGGQPNVPNTLTPTAGSVKARIDEMVDRTLAAQCAGDGTGALPAAFWTYSGCGNDASTTQYAVGGLAAARDFYTTNGSDAVRVAAINTAIGHTRTGYAHHFAGGLSPSPFGGTEGGWGYQVANAPAGHQQTASGLWVSELGAADINDAAVQEALKFERDHYDFADNATNSNGWGDTSYGYHLFSSSKAFSFLEAQNTPPNAGNTTTLDLGSDPVVVGDRAHRRDPTADGCARLAVFGVGGCAGGANATPYSNESGRWYYDYAWTIMNSQNIGGNYTVLGGGWEGVSEQAYRTLILQRSLAGVNSPPDCSAANTTVEIAMDAGHTYHDIAIGPITDNDGDIIKVTIDSVRMDENDTQWCAAFSTPAMITAPNGVSTAAGGGSVNGLVEVRAERDGLRQTPGNGRVYHILFTGTDPAGATCHGEAKVGVRFAFSMPPVDDGSNFNALVACPQ
jgi:hypothetical protein